MLSSRIHWVSHRLSYGSLRQYTDNNAAHLTDQELEEDVKQFAQNHLPFVGYENILRAARVAKDIRLYDSVARNPDFDVKNRLPVNLTDKEKYALRRERDAAFSEKGMGIVIATVSLAALLQGEFPLPCLKRVANTNCPLNQVSCNRPLMVPRSTAKNGVWRRQVRAAA